MQHNEGDTKCCCAIQGSAVGQDGRSSSLTAPNGPAQQLLIASTLMAARRPATDVALLAVHGTGTPLGDPIGALLSTSWQQKPDDPVSLYHLRKLGNISI